MSLARQHAKDRQQLALQLAGHIGKLLCSAVAAKGSASMAVSGGSTPGPLFKRLSELDIPWEYVVITLVDERWVDVEDKDSNEHLVRTHLLQNRAARATFIGMKNEAPTAIAGEQECEQRLRQVPRPLDLVILGMGNDGHTASLFPASQQLAAATAMDSGKICMAITPSTLSHARMTLTLPEILAAKQIFLHIVGAEKQRVLNQALAAGPPEAMPIRCILRQEQVPVTIYYAP
ncbi:MAG TPA: 6-phosphogluconolactonase [Desulfobulbus sp.]|nr:6-phosphogluconolactonase [Desulfobulbus sp.]